MPSDKAAPSTNGDVPKLADINNNGSDKLKKKRKHEPEDIDAKRTKDNQENKKSTKKQSTKSTTELKDTDIKAGPQISDFRVSKETIENLNKRGIATLFPIQAATFDHVFDGKDLIGRARTGTGKTLSFVLPIVEKIKAQGPSWSQVSKGRHPRVIVMAPTRELAKQTAAEFEATAPFLDCICIYGGAPYEPQERALRKGVDVVVGTPGRIMDHMDRGNLILDNIDWAVLDEADEMLNIGFADDMEKVLSSIPSTKDHQTLLFSATVPSWVNRTARQYMKADYVTVDLVGNSNVQTASNIKHLAMCCPLNQRVTVLGDVLAQYCQAPSRAIVFADTKSDATQISVSLKADSQALHGDILQNQREITLKGFKEGKFTVLVATDVAARGLDIPNVDLVVHMQPPKDVETYIHRSGRTARAGKEGTSIMLFTPQRSGAIKNIEGKAGIKFQRIGAPQLEDLISSAATNGAKQLGKVHADVVPLFLQTAKDLIEEESMPQDDEESNTTAAPPTPLEAATTLLAKALAHMAGYIGPIAKKSLMGMQPGHTSLLVRGPSTIHSPRFVIMMLERKLGKNVAQGIRITTKGDAVLDVPDEYVDTLVNLKGDYMFEVCKELPELEEDSGGRGGRGGGGGRGWGGGGGGRFGGRGGGGRDGGRRFGGGGDRRGGGKW